MRVRRLVILASVLALVPVLWRMPELLREVRTDRLAMTAYQSGLRLQAMGRLEDASAIFHKVLAIKPSASAPLVSLAEVEFRRGRFHEAVRLYRHLLNEYPYAYMGELHLGLGLAELRRGQLEAARAAFRRAAEYDPGDWFAQYLLGDVALRLGHRVEARAAWARAIDLNPDFRPARLRLQQLNESK